MAAQTSMRSSPQPQRSLRAMQIGGSAFQDAIGHGLLLDLDQQSRQIVARLADLLLDRRAGKVQR